MRIFIASPLFNAKEREQNQEIADFLSKQGYQTFLPQRDGFLLRDIISYAEKLGIINARRFANRLIGTIDAYNAYEKCQGSVLNLNGRVTDEGGLIEGTLTFCSSKPLVLYKNDGRSLIDGQDNPLILILSERVVNSYEAIAEELKRQFNERETPFQRMMWDGKLIYSRYSGKDAVELIKVAREVFKIS